MEKTSVVTIGLPREQGDFLARHTTFFERLPHLREAMDLAFIRTLHDSTLDNRAVFYLGRLCVEDFFEVIVLSGNGYGLGGLRLVRGMYERAITARYLHLHPGSAEQFMDYFWVTKHKESQALKETFGEATIPKGDAEEVERQFGRVREKFMVTDCKKCGTTRLNYTWSKLDFASMAKKVGSLGTLIVPAYYLPLEHGHSTSAGIVFRLTGSEEMVSFKDESHREEADSSLHLSHHILLDILLLQQEHFALSVLEEPIRTCFRDFVDIWEKRAAGTEVSPDSC